MKKELKKKGFTLIEVLGVIVVLAVIALITTPIIINVIEKAKKGALEDSAYGLLDSANIYYASGILDETQAKTEFTFSDGIQTSENKLSYKGKVEKGSVRLYSDGKTALCITGGEYAALKNVNDKKVSVTRGRCSYNSETEEYETRGLCQDLQDEIDALKKKHQEELDKLREEYEEKLKQAGSDKEQLIKDHEAQIKTLTEAYEAQIKELQDQLNVFKNGGTVTADQILAGKTAFVKGQLITGTMSNNKVQNTTDISSDSTNTGLNVYFPRGAWLESYSNHSNKAMLRIPYSDLASALGVKASKIAQGQNVLGIAGTFTGDANATAAGILAGQTAYVNGNKITGTMVNRGAVNATINPGESYTIPAGYHNGSGKVTASKATATIVSCGRVANGTQLNLESCYSGDWSKITNDSIYFKNISYSSFATVNDGGDHGYTGTAAPSLSVTYNSNTHIVTISSTASGRMTARGSQGTLYDKGYITNTLASADLYLIY